MLRADGGVDAVFAPPETEMYPRPPLCVVEVAVSPIICAGRIVPAISAASRPSS